MRGMSEGRRILRVAISCAGETVPRKHFGDCPEFRIYELSESSEARLLEVKDNTSPEEERHADPKKLKGVIGLLPECDLVVSGLESPNFMRIRDTKPIQPVVTDEETVDATLKALHRAFEDLYGLIEARRRGEFPAVIPRVRNG